MHKTLANLLYPTSQIVIQSTSFCNLDCTYCYLTDRNIDHRVSWDTVKTLLIKLELYNLLAESIEIRWHAGEPLIVPMDFYESCVTQISGIIAPQKVISHSLQTNATLITREHARRLSALNMRVGVSLDGPEWLHDKSRRYRSGRGSFKAVMKGIEALQNENVPFEIISVVTKDTAKYCSQFYQFLESTGAIWLGLNFEETEGTHLALWRNEDISVMEGFARDLYTYSKKGSLKVREFEILERLIFAKRGASRDLQNLCGAIIALGANGEITTYSPELLGLTYDGWPSFAIGKIDKNSNELHINDALLSKMKLLIEKGVENCRNQCQYFSVCGGGRPINKLFENGHFDSTETIECRLRVKMLTKIMIGAIEKC